MANLLLAAGLAYALPGAVLVVSSFSGRGRHGDAPAYPRLLAKRGGKRLDRRVGSGLMVFGGLSLAAACYGYSAPLSLWRYPAAVAAAVLVSHAIARLRVLRPVHRGASVRARQGLFESRRAVGLRVAAERESAGILARELASAPRDTGVVYLRKHWDRRWWSDRLGVSTDAIEAAVNQVGPMAHDVRRHLATA